MALLADELVPEWLFRLLAWVPAIIFPAASGLQLLAIVHKRNADGVSVPAWAMFAVANTCLFIYTEKYSEWESILGALGTASINVCIVIACFRYRTHDEKPDERNANQPPSV
jgi:uncharacterized protein with PQ loop repeat